MVWWWYLTFLQQRDKTGQEASYPTVAATFILFFSPATHELLNLYKEQLLGSALTRISHPHKISIKYLNPGFYTIQTLKKLHSSTLESHIKQLPVTLGDSSRIRCENARMSDFSMCEWLHIAAALMRQTWSETLHPESRFRLLETPAYTLHGRKPHWGRTDAWSLTPLWHCDACRKCACTVSCWVWCRGPPGPSRWRGRLGRTATRSDPGVECPAHAPPHHSASSASSRPSGWRCWGWSVYRRSRRRLACLPSGQSEDDGRLEGTRQWIYAFPICRWVKVHQRQHSQS